MKIIIKKKNKEKKFESNKKKKKSQFERNKKKLIAQLLSSINANGL